MNTVSVESFTDVAERFPGIDELEARAVARFIFYSAGDFPQGLYDASRESWGVSAIPQWESDVSAYLFDVEQWRQEPADRRLSRIDLSNKIKEEVELTNDTRKLLEQMRIMHPDTASDSILEYIRKWNFDVEVSLAASPLFPEGRVIRKPFEDYVRDNHEVWVPYAASVNRKSKFGSETRIHDDILDFLQTGYHIAKTKEQIEQALEGLNKFDEAYHSGLRAKYGSKAANLIIFSDALHQFYESATKDGVSKVKVPDFTTVEVDLYKAWMNDQNELFEELLEKVRLEAVELAREAVGGMVAIRSSAVYSEDNDDLTGAGIYESDAEDPNDREAFRRSIISVFESVNDENAVSYRLISGIEYEEMGLIIQTYIEDSSRQEGTYGYVNSRGTHPNIIEVHTTEGILLFDKQKIAENMFLGRWVKEADFLHSNPDHSRELSRLPQKVIEAVYASLFAEGLFKRPIQVEFVGNGSIVQVRPLPRKAFENDARQIEFPTDETEIIRSRSIGAGDEVLEELNVDDDNADREGFVVFWTEYGFTDTYHFRRHGVGARALPKKGAVVIVNRSDSGHIQTLCQERGLMCFYPDQRGEELDVIQEYTGESSGREEPRTLRFVSDGYHGRIFES